MSDTTDNDSSGTERIDTAEAFQNVTKEVAKLGVAIRCTCTRQWHPDSLTEQT